MTRRQTANGMQRPLNVACTSSEHALDPNTKRQCQPQSGARTFRQSKPPLLMLPLPWNLIPFPPCVWGVCTRSDSSLYYTLQIYSAGSWRTWHICSFRIDMFLKTEVSSTTVKYALSMTGPSSIIRTSISSLFPLHFLALRDKIAACMKSLLAYKSWQDLFSLDSEITIVTARRHWAVPWELDSCNLRCDEIFQ